MQESNTEISSASQGYDRSFIELVELVYGEGFLSQGGIEVLDEMFENSNLDNLKVLDLGSGLGAPDLYLGEKFTADIIGVDPQLMMVQEAQKNLEKNKDKLIGSVSFALLENPTNLSQFGDETFDVVFSKESLLHVPLEFKDAYFKEIYRVLKPNGKIIIMDWMHSSPHYSEKTKKMMEMDEVAFNLVTPKEYVNSLELAGFKNIIFSDTTQDHARISQENIDTIDFKKEIIRERFGEETYLYSLESWGMQRDAFDSRELLTGWFQAQKN